MTEPYKKKPMDSDAVLERAARQAHKSLAHLHRALGGQEMNNDDLRNRVGQFRSMSLPGQPLGMHMGTFQLVNDLAAEVDRLEAVLRGIATFDCYTREDEEPPAEAMRRMAEGALDRE